MREVDEGQVFRGRVRGWRAGAGWRQRGSEGEE